MADILTFKTNEEKIQELCLKIINDLYSACMTCEDEGDYEVNKIVNNVFTIESMESLVELIDIDPEFAEIQKNNWERLINYIAEKAQGSSVENNTILN